MQVKMVDLYRSHEPIMDKINEAYKRIFETSQFINGEDVKEFEKELGEYLGGVEVIGCASGTDALMLSLMALDLPEGAEIITSPFTFVATVEVIVFLGLKPVFVDIDPLTFNIDVEQLEDAISDRTYAIMPVHLFGHPADMQPILEIAGKYDLAIIEDNAQALGATYQFPDGQRQFTGTMGTLAGLSFFPSKNLGGVGDGGAVLTKDPELAAKVRIIANHGSAQRYKYDRIGVNSRLDSLQAAVLRIKLPFLDEYNALRREKAAIYDELLAEIEEIETPYEEDYAYHVYHQYVIKLDNEHWRDPLHEFLLSKGVQNAIYYPEPIHLSKAYRFLGYSQGDFPMAEYISQKVLALPMHPFLTEDEQKYVVDCIKEFFANGG